MRPIISDYPLPSYIDTRVSETELRAAVQYLTDVIADARQRRNNYEEILTRRFIEGLERGEREDNVRSKPFVSDLNETYERRAKKKFKKWRINR